MKKKAFLLAAALVGVTSTTLPQTSEPNDLVTTTDSGVEANSTAKDARNGITKTTIIESLKTIRKDPATVKFHSAMCYDMVMPPPDTTFSCPACGATTQYKTQSFAGKVADWVPSLERMLGMIQARNRIDYSDFCTSCRKNGDQAQQLRFTTHCIDCSKTFNWSVNNEHELEQLRLLTVNFPVTEVDQGEKGSNLIAPEELSQYLSHRLLCPECRQKHNLE